MDCFVCGRKTLKGAAIHEACKVVERDKSEEQEAREKGMRLKTLTAELIVGVVETANRRCDALPMVKK